jgi:shikimate kinase
MPPDTESYRLMKTVVLVGMMGAGKSTIGRKLAQRIGARFVDADTEIERAANCTIPEYFEKHGEEAFREGERRVIARLLQDPPHVLAMGGGAFINEETRAATRKNTTSIWLSTDVDTLFRRVSRRGNRPMLYVDDPKAELEKLLAKRTPTYAEADLTVEGGDAPSDVAAADAEAKLRHIGILMPTED